MKDCFNIQILINIISHFNRLPKQIYTHDGVRKSNRNRISKFPKKHPQLDRSNPWKPKADILFNDEGLSHFYPGRK